MSSGARAAVEAVERRAREHREHQATEPYFGLARCGKGEVVARHLVCSRGERVRLEARMRELLDDGEDVTEGCTDER
jgi:hypothetical protein